MPMLDGTLMRAQMPIGAFGAPSVPAMPAFAPFPGKAPSPTPYGAFAWQAPTALSDVGRFRLDQGMNALQRGAAARGTLLSGGLQKRLLGFGQELAAEEADKDFGRALTTYTTNRDTHALNFNQPLQSFQADLGAFGANTDAALGFGRLGLDTYDRAAQGAQVDQRNAFLQSSLADARQADAADEYARNLAAQRAFGAQQAAMERSVLPAKRTASPAIPRDYRPGGR